MVLTGDVLGAALDLVGCGGMLASPVPCDVNTDGSLSDEDCRRRFKDAVSGQANVMIVMDAVGARKKAKAKDAAGRPPEQPDGNEATFVLFTSVPYPAAGSWPQLMTPVPDAAARIGVLRTSSAGVADSTPVVIAPLQLDHDGRSGPCLGCVTGLTTWSEVDSRFNGMANFTNFGSACASFSSATSSPSSTSKPGGGAEGGGAQGGGGGESRHHHAFLRTGCKWAFCVRSMDVYTLRRPRKSCTKRRRREKDSAAGAASVDGEVHEEDGKCLRCGEHHLAAQCFAKRHADGTRLD